MPNFVILLNRGADESCHYSASLISLFTRIGCSYFHLDLAASRQIHVERKRIHHFTVLSFVPALISLPPCIPYFRHVFTCLSRYVMYNMLNAIGQPVFS